MKTKECKVTFVDNLETDYEVRPLEIKANEYRVYARPLKGKYSLIKTTDDKKKAIDIVKGLNPKEFDGKFIIEHDYKTDTDNFVDIER